MSQTRRWVLLAVLLACLWLCFATPALADTPLWSDDFNGGFDQTWTNVDYGSKTSFVRQLDRYELHTEKPTGPEGLAASYVDQSGTTVLLKGTVRSIDAGDVFLAYLIARADFSLGNAYALGISSGQASISNEPHLWLGKFSSGAYSNFEGAGASVFPWGLGKYDWYDCHLKFALVGGNLYGKVWKTTEPEPAQWQVSAGDSSFASGYGGVAVATYSPIGWSSVQAAWDDVSMSESMERWVDGSFNSSTLGWGVTHFATIQSAINAAVAGDTIHVAAGTYAEYVVVNKSVTLTGEPGAVIQKPTGDVYYKLPDEGTAKSFRPILLAYGGSITAGDGASPATAYVIQGSGTVNVTISGFHIDGRDAWTGATSSNFADGVLLRNVVGTLSGMTIDNMLFTDTNQFTLGVEVRGDNSNVTLSGNSITEFGRVGILVAGNLGTPVAHLTGNNVSAVYYGPYVTNGIELNYRATGSISGNTVSGATGAGTIWSGACVMLTDADNVSIYENDVSDCEVGISVGGRANNGYAARNNVIRDNTVDNCVYSSIEVNTNSQNTTIRNNTITGVAARGGTEEAGIVILEYSNPLSGYPNGVLIEGNSISGDPGFWGIDIYRNADNVVIQNNIVTGGAVALALELKESNSVGKNITIGGATGKSNSFSGQTVLAISTGPYSYSGVTYQWTPDVNASGNWLGTADIAGVAAAVSANVDYTPWLTSGADGSTDPGFQGDFSTLWVDDDSPQTGTTGRIQEGINLVSGSTVHVAAGTYTERVVANKAVTLLGPNAGIDPCSGSRVAEAEIHTDDLTNHQAVLISSLDVTVDGFTVYGPNGEIKNIGALGLDGSGPRTNVHIQYNRIFRTAGGTDWNGDGIRLDPPSNEAASIFVEHNRIESGSGNKGNNNISLADHGYRTAHGSTWTVGAPDRVTIAHNCLYGHGKMYIEGIGVLIDDNVFSGEWGPIEVRGAKDVVISNNEMLNQVDIGIFAWSPASASGAGVCTDLRITGNTIQGMQLDPQDFTDEGTAIVLGGVTNATVSGNNLTGNANYGVVIGGIGYDHFYPEDIGWGGGLDVGYSPVNNVLDHNNISGNVVAGVINKTTVMVNAENNWWGDASGPLDTNGTSECPPCNSNAALDKNLDGAGNAVSEYVDYCPWLGAPPPEAGTLLYLDPVLGSVPNDHTTTKTYTVRIANVANMYGYQFVVSFDPAKLECTAAAFDGTFFPIGDGESFAPGGWKATIDNVNGKVYFARTLQDPQPALTGSGPLATVTFRGDEGASDGQYKLDFQQTKLANKDGDALPVTAQFGWLELYGTGNLAGSVDLQGRSNESGAVVTIISVGGHTAWTTTVVNGSWSFTGIPAVSYQVNIEQERYLDAQKGAAGSGVVVTAGGTTTLNQVKLLGGDANDDDLVDISDATIIGGEFGKSGGGISDFRADINNDGTVDIMDLVLFGGNYSKTSPVPWS